MKSKQTLFIEHLQTNPNLFQCPYCDDVLSIDHKTLRCPLGHCFDLHKKGTLTLVKTHLLKQDDVYNKDLFDARRRFIKHGFYDDVHDVLKTYATSKSVWCDMGSGEGSHGHKMIQGEDAFMVGLDLSKPAIALASDYLVDGYCPVVADLAHMPLVAKSMDGILNFLSPSNELEMARILKDDGIILKVVPDKDYLKELRQGLDMDEFVPTDYQFRHFDIMTTHHLKKVYKLGENDFKDLLAMTPLSQYKEIQTTFNTITIDLRILVLKKKEAL